MPNITIKKAVTEEEQDIAQDMRTYAFAPSPKLERDTTRRKYHETSTTYLLSEDGNAVSTLLSIPMTENVRGKIFKMQGIAGVATYPEGRRKGFVKQLMRQSLLDCKKEGMVLSTLYPFRQSFYGRFGYVTFPQVQQAKFNPSNLKDVKEIKTKSVITRHLVKENIDRYYSFLQKIQEKRHGLGLFNKETIQELELAKSWIVFAEQDGEDRGAMVFTTGGFEKEINIQNLFYLDADAKYSLLKHISLHIDQFHEVNMRVFADEKPENWAYDLRIEKKNRQWVPSAMGRVLDVSKLEGMQVGSGSVSIEVYDEDCEWNNGNWEFSSEKGFLNIEKSISTNGKLTIQGLSALIYGGYTTDDLVFRGWLEGSTEFLMKLDLLFPPKIPVLFSIF